MIILLSVQFFYEGSNEIKTAQVKLETLKKNSKEIIDEKKVTLADAKGIAEGKKIFMGTCFPCHGANGEGNAVGPNLMRAIGCTEARSGMFIKQLPMEFLKKGCNLGAKHFIHLK